MRNVLSLVALTLIPLVSASAARGDIVLDSFGPNSSLAGSGITATASNTPQTTTDSGRSDIFGGDRTTTLSFVSGSSSNSSVNLSISGASGNLEYKSSNGANIAKGSFDLLYNGSAGFPANLSGGSAIQVDVNFQNNPDAGVNYIITLTDGKNQSSSQSEFLLNNNGAVVSIGLSGFTGVNLSNIKSIDLTVDAKDDTNLQLGGIKISGVNGGGDPKGGTGVGAHAPEPSSFLMCGLIALGVGGFFLIRRRRRQMQAI